MKKTVYAASIALALGMTSAAWAHGGDHRDHSSDPSTTNTTVNATLTHTDESYNTINKSFSLSNKFNLSKNVAVTKLDGSVSDNSVNDVGNHAFGFGGVGGSGGSSLGMAGAKGGSAEAEGAGALSLGAAVNITPASRRHHQAGSASNNSQAWGGTNRALAGDALAQVTTGNGAAGGAGTQSISAGSYDASNNISGGGISAVGITTVSQNTGANALTQQGVTVQGNVSFGSTP